ncbi:alpha-E domain-containing protein [Gilvimarinus agarilyticus]|uniref:alpha-E domain-containing protein n=1 Tax=unclassified Gilvimarinus TaxID=2642066 RepID=UPI001C097DC6|nr:MULTISPECIES: alpha-E domain-containing protein [unclassified Gilvimarinus]MBU2885028.1 alpha-E domain-containing protein [Gilvimarinus agarilyticus]MDO6569925.1 alpha-E domain-containing protein [Gilvimarinus sp. 2_MG-2023]MDO6747134.1 alpha-E domain-containing protein [Gilvimarinus sp. 1_MG-2023]
MLSRVAERVYWMGRYMERCENVARLVDVNTKLLLDLPRGVSVGWGTLIDISGGSDFYRRDLDSADERAVMRFLLADQNNPSSLISSITCARENARITREIMPSEVYTLVNDLYLYLKERLPKGIARGERQALLEEVIVKVQQFSGMLAGCMSHNDAYGFLRLGCNLERADMTSRIVDVGTRRILTKALTEIEANEPFENILWMSVLRSLSGYQMYRQHVLDRVNAEDVVMFLLQDPLFPRAVEHCLSELSESFSRLPNSDDPQRVLVSVKRQLKTADIPQLLESGLEEHIESIQASIGEVHSAIATTWFLPQAQVAP